MLRNTAGIKYAIEKGFPLDEQELMTQSEALQHNDE